VVSEIPGEESNPLAVTAAAGKVPTRWHRAAQSKLFCTSEANNVKQITIFRNDHKP
jgi:hypothetical protein